MDVLSFLVGDRRATARPRTESTEEKRERIRVSSGGGDTGLRRIEGDIAVVMELC